MAEQQDEELQLDPEMQKEFAFLDDAIEFKMTSHYPDGLTKDQKRSVRRKAQTIFVEHGEILIKKKRGKVKILLEEKAKQRALQSCHLPGHFGTSKTWLALCERYYWNGMSSDVKRMVSKSGISPNTQYSMIELQFMDCHLQSGESDCGLFAIANATALIFGEDPGRLFYEQASMRQHLFKCLENKHMLLFPTKRRRRALKQVVTVDAFEVHCICRMPEMFVGEKWAGCTKCKKWYHTDSCLNVADKMLEGDWICPGC